MVQRTPGALAARLCVALALAGLAASTPRPRTPPHRTFALEDLVPPRREFYPERISGQWISATKYVFMDPGGGYMIYNADENTTRTFLTEDIVRSLNHSISSFSEDGKYLLLSSDTKKVYRWSSMARYYVYEVETGLTWPVGEGHHIQTCVWGGGAGGGGGGGAALAFVRGNNVYYTPDAARAVPALRLTDDGRPGEIYNGVADWIYEEEILNSADAMWFSVDGSHLAVASFNDTLVESAQYQYYGSPAHAGFQYPVTVQFKYPKVGRTNPNVTLRVFQLNGDSGVPVAISIAAPAQVGSDHILGSVNWASDTRLVVLWLNRRQNTSVLVRCDLDTGTCETVRIQNEPDGWIDISDALFDASGDRMVDVSPAPSGGGDRHPHAVLTDLRMGAAVDLTPGKVTVISVLGWQRDRDVVYYLAASRTQPWERHVWAARAGGVACVTCGVLGCGSVSAQFAPSAAHGVFVCSATNQPPRTYMYNAEKETLTLWQSNSALAATLSEFALPGAEYAVLRLAEGVTAHARLLLPPDLAPGSRHPLLLKVYAGPGSSRVLDKYELDYSTYLASNRSYVVGYVDVRGSGAMGTRALHAVNNALGTVEVDDTLLAIRELTKKYSFIDDTRVGVWGWSYGGYTAALMLAHNRGLLRCAAAVAPVTSWLYYDSIYTERYMGTPAENPLGYERSDLLLQAKKLRGRKLLLVHGNADDNVHYQHSMLLAKQLQHADIAFEQMSYPDENHSLAGVSRHLYHTLDHFWSECFA